jgi:hypothetical protein
VKLLGSLHRIVLRLLQDDDEEIREGAAEIVQRGLKLERGICQAKALELEWNWLATHYRGDARVLEWIAEICIDEKVFGTFATTLFER